MTHAPPTRLVSSAAIAAMLLAACGGDGAADTTSTTPPATMTEAQRPTTTTVPPHPFLADIAESMEVEVTEAEEFVAGVAAEEGVDVGFLLGLGDFEDLLSPISPTLEEIRRSLPGEFLEDLCPLAAPLPGVSAFGTEPGIYKVIAAAGFEDGLGDWTDDRAEEPERFVERWVGFADSKIEGSVAVGDAYREITYQLSHDDFRRLEVPVEWLAASHEEIALVACVTPEKTDEVIRTCDYHPAGSSREVVIETRRAATRVEVYEAATATRVAELLVPGPGPTQRDCPFSISLSEENLDEARGGPLVNYEQQPSTAAVLTAIERVVAPPELSPAAAANAGEHRYEVEVHEEGCNLRGGGEATRRISFGPDSVAIDDPDKENPPKVFESTGEDTYMADGARRFLDRLLLTFSIDGYLLENQQQGPWVLGEPNPWETCGRWVYTLAD